MRGLQREGKARFVGITGLQLNLLRRIAEAVPVDVVLSYCRYNLLITDLDKLLTPFVKERGIGLINASPLHMGILTTSGPPPWHPAAAEVKEAGHRIVELCEHRGVRASDLALQFAFAHPYIATTLAGMPTVEQVRQNVAAASKPVDEPLLAEVLAFAAPYKNRRWPTGLPENHDA
jgi:L-galactose dehydrogenase